MRYEGCGFCLPTLEYPHGRAHPNTNRWVFQKWCEEMDVQEVLIASLPKQSTAESVSTDESHLFWPLREGTRGRKKRLYHPIWRWASFGHPFWPLRKPQAESCGKGRRGNGQKVASYGEALDLFACPPLTSPPTYDRVLPQRKKGKGKKASPGAPGCTCCALQAYLEYYSQHRGDISSVLVRNSPPPPLPIALWAYLDSYWWHRRRLKKFSFPLPTWHPSQPRRWSVDGRHPPLPTWHPSLPMRCSVDGMHHVPPPPSLATSQSPGEALLGG